MGQAPILLWLRDDLRLDDHPALTAAVTAGGPVVPVYVHDEQAAGDRRPGAASRWWLHHSLMALEAELRGKGSRLLLRRGAAEELLVTLAADCGAAEVYCSRAYEPWGAAQEKRVADACARVGVRLRCFTGGMLFEPEDICTGSGGIFKVFTPYYNACLRARGPQPPLPSPGRIPAPAAWPRSEELTAWRLTPDMDDRAAEGKWLELWRPGAPGGAARLADFLENGLAGYATLRDRPDIDGSSALSPHLHFGEVGPRRCWHATVMRMEASPSNREGGTAFLRELLWRDFARYILFHRPEAENAPLRAEFTCFPWREDPAALQAWKTGETGVPMVDAAMRQLLRTGWIHNRARMIAASFLCKNLLIDWREGERWFFDNLLDADLANNVAGWQWVAGCGMDAAPYFRVFNPVLQGRKFDPRGAYVRKFLPELYALADAHIHAPWEGEKGMFGDEASLKNYPPRPLVDLGASRLDALAAHKQARAVYEAMLNRPSPAG